MFFILSKLIWFVLAPVNLMLLLIGLGAVLQVGPGLWVVRAGRRLATGCGLLLLACGVLPVGTLLLRPLEDRFPQIAADLPPPSGIVVLGGSTDQRIGDARNRVTIPDAAERLTEAVILSRRYPAARIVFTGGSGALLGTRLTEAEEVRKLWIAMGIPPERITTEDRSRNTDENARFVKALVDPKPDERWLLVTSAFHMPRAVALFRANGFPVVPDPVDFRTSGTPKDFVPGTDMAGALGRLNVAVREWVGLIAYRLTGRTDTLFPGPDPVNPRS